jgi:hypothetical protein
MVKEPSWETTFETRWHTRRNQISSFGETDRVHLNQRGCQFSRLLAAEVCASAVVMLDTPCSEVAWRVLATHSFRKFPPSLPLPCITVCHHVSTGLYTSVNNCIPDTSAKLIVGNKANMKLEPWNPTLTQTTRRLPCTIIKNNTNFIQFPSDRGHVTFILIVLVQ